MEILKKTAGTLLLAAAVLYHGAAFYDMRTDSSLRGVVGYIFWPSYWEMFTGLQRTHSQYSFEHYVPAEGWVATPYERWVPYQWESGHRWNRTTVRDSRPRRVAFFVDVCAKTQAPRVRFVNHRWRATLGSMEQPRTDYEKVVVEEWVCGQPGVKVAGRRI